MPATLLDEDAAYRMGQPLDLSCVLPVAGAEVLLTHMPGRHTTESGGRRWSRDADRDLATIRDWGASHVVVLLEAAEFAPQGVPDYIDRLRRTGLQAIHLPIRDLDLPGVPFAEGVARHATDLQAALAPGRRVALHCAAGLGRTGTIAAALLMRTGLCACQAVSRVRSLRPGTIETAAQLAWVKAGPRLGF